MTFERWAAQEFASGDHVLRDLPLDQLHPLKQSGLQIRISISDDVISSCTFEVRDLHRGDERLLEVRDLRQGLALVNRHGWLTASFAETLFARIAEDMLGMTISARADALRDLAMALNAAATSALWEHLDASLVGRACDALVAREALLEEYERLTGARMHATYVRIGGVAADIDPSQLSELTQHGDATIAAAARAVAASSGDYATALPKVVRLPHGDAYQELMTPHGRLGMWIVSRGDKVPHRVHLRTAGFATLARLERDAIGLSMHEFLMKLAHTRLVLGEVAR